MEEQAPGGLKILPTNMKRTRYTETIEYYVSKQKDKVSDQ
jgi:hypothetical protein